MLYGQLRNSTGGGNVHELPAFRVVLGGGKHILGAAHIDGDQLLAVTRVDGDHAGTVDADALAALGDVEEGFAVLGAAPVSYTHLAFVCLLVKMFFAQKMHDKFSRISLSLPGQKYACLLYTSRCV